jgi:nitric oxide reductase NorQ protein
VDLASRLRRLKGQDVEEAISTRLLVYCASLIDSGMPPREAVRAAIIEPLSDDADVRLALSEVAFSLIA